MKAILLALAALLAVSTAAADTDLAGGWKGVWVRKGEALPVTVSFVKSDKSFSGSFDSDALQVAGIPFSDVEATSGKIHWLLKGDQTTTVFNGVQLSDAISGTLKEGDTAGTFDLKRIALPVPAVVTRDVTFSDRGVTLAGTLLLPPAPGRHAAILFLQGSGPEGRWANRYLAQKFAQAGIVALIYDKRGVGQSTGNWQKAGFDALAQDAIAGIDFLRLQTEVDPKCVGIYGHSQGGTIAPLVAVGDGHLGFVVASAAGGIAPSDVETYSVENTIGLAQLPAAAKQDAKAYVDALIDVAYRGKDRATLDALAAKFKDRDWYFEAPPAGNSYWDISGRIAGFDPSHWWRKVHAPVLLVYGAHDERVPPKASTDAIRAALAAGGNPHLTVKLYPDADHTFTIVAPPEKGGWPLHEPDYADALVKWVQEQASSAAQAKTGANATQDRFDRSGMLRRG